MDNEKSARLLHKVNDRLIEDCIVYDGDIVTSKRGVPYLWLDRNKLNISVCYFGRSKSFKIWTGCGTPENKKHATVKLWVDVIPIIEELITQRLNKKERE